MNLEEFQFHDMTEVAAAIENLNCMCTLALSRVAAPFSPHFIALTWLPGSCMSFDNTLMVHSVSSH